MVSVVTFVSIRPKRRSRIARRVVRHQAWVVLAMKEGLSACARGYLLSLASAAFLAASMRCLSASRRCLSTGVAESDCAESASADTALVSCGNGGRYENEVAVWFASSARGRLSKQGCICERSHELSAILLHLLLGPHKERSSHGDWDQEVHGFCDGDGPPRQREARIMNSALKPFMGLLQPAGRHS